MPITILEKYRTERGWSQSKLAHRAGVHSGSISQIERGRLVPASNSTTLQKIAAAFGMDLSLAHTLVQESTE